MQDNHLAIYHVYRSSGRDHLDCHFFSLARAITASTLAESARDLPLPERELDFLADFYMYAIAGMMMGWLSDDMREEPEEIVGRLDRLLEGEFRRAAEKFSAGEPVS
ncbi:MAG: TetR-like C-terminal domain-containing protein [Flavonifractor plautii]